MAGERQVKDDEWISRINEKATGYQPDARNGTASPKSSASKRVAVIKNDLSKRTYAVSDSPIA